MLERLVRTTLIEGFDHRSTRLLPAFLPPTDVNRMYAYMRRRRRAARTAKLPATVEW